MAVDDCDRRMTVSVRLRRIRKGEAGIEDQLCVLTRAAADQVPAVLVADRDGGKVLQLLRPLRRDSVPGAVIAEACGISDQPVSPEAVAEKDRLAAVPGVAEVPNLVAAYDDRVICVRGFGLM
jgi:hypothetical protein